MIVLHSGGGLGNQLFNYAAARSLADRNRTSLVVDAIEYRTQWHADASRPFVLHRFPVRAKFRNFGPAPLQQWIGARALRRVREDLFATHVDRPSDQIGFFNEFNSLGARSTLKGHYIDPRFFTENETNIRADLTLPNSMFSEDTLTQEILKKIQTTAAVSVHVRRGDLLGPAFRWILLPEIEKYYEKAFELLQDRLGTHTLFVFSDDPEWCRETFRGVSVPITYVSSGKNSDLLRDFYLMTQCDHHVIANSAFSWWAAWLAKGADKQVIAPFRWETRGVVDMAHFLPADWMRLAW